MKSQFLCFLRIILAEPLPLGLIITILSLAHSLLFCSYGIFSGLHNDFFQQIKHHRPHIILRPAEGFFHENELKKIMAAEKQIRHIEPVLISQGVLTFQERFFTGVLIRGLKNQLPTGQIRISEGLATEITATKGEAVTLVVADGSHHDLILNGFFPDYGFADLRQTIEMELGFAQKIITGETMINQLELKLSELKKTPEISQKIQKLYPGWRLESWKNTYAETIKLFRVEKILHFGIFAVLLIFCFFSIYCAFILLFLRREKSLICLIKLGLPAKRMKLFLLLTIHILVFLSLGTGTVLAFCVKKYLQLYPLELPTSLFYSAHLPFLWVWGFWFSTALFIYAAALLAFFLPAKKLIHN